MKEILLVVLSVYTKVQLDRMVETLIHLRPGCLLVKVLVLEVVLLGLLFEILEIFVLKITIPKVLVCENILIDKY